MPATRTAGFAAEVRFSDVDEFAEAVRGWDLDFRQAAPGPFVCEMVQGGSEAGLLAEVRFGSSITQHGIAPGAGRTFGFVCTTSPLEWCARSVTADDLLVFEAGSEFGASSAPGFHVFTLTVPTERLLARCERLGLAPPAVLTSANETVLRVPHHTRAVVKRLRAVRAACRTMSAPAARELLAEEIAGGITSALVRALAFPSARSARPPGWQRVRALRRALEHIRDQRDAVIRISELSSVCAVSERTIEYAFKEYLGVGPKAYLMAHRLAAVRRGLRDAGPDERVTQIATDWGFLHMGQFAADYRRHFGELPSRTLRG